MQNKLKDLQKEFNTSLEGGLTDEQVIINRNIYGKNALEEKKKTPLIIRFLKQFNDVLIIILIIAAVISVIIDPHEYIESIIILLVVILNAVLGLFQESKAEKSLDALKKMSSATCKVIRNNSLITILSDELVVGDIIYVEAGDQIPADAKIFECSNLSVEEAALTGESVPVNKNSEYIEDDDIPLGDKKNCLFSSTYVTNGKGKAIVTNVGMNTEIGKIAKMLNEQNNTLTPLQNKLNSVGKAIGFMALGICAVVFILGIISSYMHSSDLGFVQVFKNKWLGSFKNAIALAVAAIPEGLATVVTIVLSIGVTKMSKQKAIVKKLPAVETLGSCNVICSDKTGTLTQNKMTVKSIYLNGVKGLENITAEEKMLITYFAICCDAKVENINGKINRIGDPTELALIDVNLLYGNDLSNYNRILDIPFDSDRKLMTTVIKIDDYYLAITKGAPDNVIRLSNNSIDVLDNAIKANNEMASNALRVLALAIKKFNRLPNIDELECDLEFLGLVGMIDPARPEVKDAIKIATNAGIKTVMITGDHIDTAKAIAKELGILNEGDKAITSIELNELSDEYLFEHIHEYSVYARVAPKDKVRIVEAWQRHNAICAMTGDGVNDAPALKKADIGCAMGITGTDVSKEAADMILMDDNFTTIVSAVKQGRCIYDNIQKCVKYLLSSNIGEVIAIFVASIISVFTANVGLPLSPIHLLWINLITDSLPAFGIGMEEATDDVMKEKPRGKTESFFANNLALKIILEGLVIGTITLIAYLIGNKTSQQLGQTMAFLTLSSTQLFHAYSVKSNNSVFTLKAYKNKFMNLAFAVGFILQILVIYTPGINKIFKFNTLSFSNFMICIGLSLIMVLIMEIYKFIVRKRNK